MDPFNPRRTIPRQSHQSRINHVNQINQHWRLPKVLAIVFAISLIILGLFPHYLAGSADNSGATIARYRDAIGDRCADSTDHH